MFVPRLVRSLLLTVEEIAYARACCSSCELALRPSYPDLGGNNTHHAHGYWPFHLMRHAEGGARHASGASSPLPCTIFAGFQYISQECHRWCETLAL